MHRTVWFGFLSLCLLPSTIAVAAKPNSQEKRDDQRVNAARNDVAEAQRKLAEESKDVREAAAALQKALAEAAQEAKRVSESRLESERRIAQREGLDAEQAAVLEARTRFESASRPVLDRLQATAEYQAAKAAAAAARGKLEAGDPPDAAALREAMFVPGKLEQAALSADTETSKLRTAMDERAKRLAELRTRIHEAVDSDSDVRRGLERLIAAKAVAEKAERTLAAERARALAAIVKLQQEEAQLRQAISQDKKNDQKNKKNDPKKKKPANKSKK